MEIIIVDDEPVSLTALKQIVEKHPACRVRGFAEASAALSWCADNDPDVVIVGYVMPELNGVEFVKHLRSLTGKKETPVLMVTANVDQNIRAHALRVGVNDLLNKPYDSAELQARVGNMLLLRARQRKLPDPSSFVAADRSRAAAPDTGERAVGHTLLDLNMTLTRLGDDETLLNQVARVFMRTAPGLLQAISEALEHNDSERAYAEAHSLKGAIAVFEAPEVFNSIVAVETHAHKYDSRSAAAAFRAARALVERLMSELSALLREPGAGPVPQL
jgi:DNA-binding response OmpR family regulator